MRSFSILFFALLIFGVQCKFSFDSYAESSESRSDSSSSVEDDDTKCPKGAFLLEADDKCHPCSRCGPSLYVAEECTPESDTVCDWCFSTKPTQNLDFKLKCGDVAIKSIFRIIVKPQQEEPDQDDSYDIFSRDEGRLKEIRRWAAAASIAKFSFYFLLVILIVIVIRYVRKSKQTYRTITMMPPVLDEHDNKDLIRVAGHIREKLGKKGYNRLEEFV